MSEVNETKKSQAVHEGDRKLTDLQSRVRTLENLCYSAKEVLNLEEAASFLGIAKSTLYKMTHENRIPWYVPMPDDGQTRTTVDMRFAPASMKMVEPSPEAAISGTELL